jgi:hypothetical protein
VVIPNVTFLVPTATGLEKSIMDATQEVRDFLVAADAHNYDGQQHVRPKVYFFDRGRKAAVMFFMRMFWAGTLLKLRLRCEVAVLLLSINRAE